MLGKARCLASLLWLMQPIAAHKAPEPGQSQPTPSSPPPIVAAQPRPPTRNASNTIQMRKECPSLTPSEATTPRAAETSDEPGYTPCADGLLLSREPRQLPHQHQHQRQLGELEDQVTDAIHSVLAQEMGELVQEIADKALRRIHDRMLSFTMRGERYLCLNVTE